MKADKLKAVKCLTILKQIVYLIIDEGQENFIWLKQGDNDS